MFILGRIAPLLYGPFTFFYKPNEELRGGPTALTGSRNVSARPLK